MERLRKKKLKKEKTEINQEFIGSIKLFVGLVLLVASFVSVVLYIPSVKKNNSNNPESKYGTESEEKIVDTSGLSCASDVNKSLLSESNKVKVQYKYTTKMSDEKYLVITEGWDEEEEQYESIELNAFQIDIMNITDNLTAVVTNNSNDEEYNINYSDTTKGVYSIITTDVYKVIKYTIQLYSAVGECKGELVRKYEVSLPIYNINSDNRYCSINAETNECAVVTYDDELKAANFATEEESEKATKENNTNKKTSKIGSITLPDFTLLNVVIITAIIVTIIMIVLFIINKISLHRMKVRNEKL